MRYPQITQVAKYVPEKIVTNDDLSEMMDTSDDWIFSRTGIKERHIVTNETTADLCVEVGRALLKQSGLPAEEIDFIIVATMTADYGTPATACLVQNRLGASSALAFDVNAACSGFVYALATAEKFLSSGNYQKGIVIGGETLSSIMDWTDRSTAVLFGDGAGGVLLERTSTTPRFLGELLQSDGARGLSLSANKRVNRSPFAHTQDDSGHYLAMEGKKIFDFALRDVSKNIVTMLDAADTPLADIDYVLPHQANIRIIDSIAKKTKIPREKFLSNLAHYGNTSAASIPLLLSDAIAEGTLVMNSGQQIVLTGYGGGLTWGSLLISF